MIFRESSIAILHVCVEISHGNMIQYWHLIPAPVDRTSASALCTNTRGLCVCQNKASTSMTHVCCKSKLRSVVRSLMHTSPGNWVAVRREVVYHARDACTLRAGIKYPHCISCTLVHSLCNAQNKILKNPFFVFYLLS